MGHGSSVTHYSKEVVEEAERLAGEQHVETEDILEQQSGAMANLFLRFLESLIKKG